MECPEFKLALAQENVRLNEANRVVSTVTGEVLPLRTGSGGMKSLFSALAPMVPVSSTNAITIDTEYASVGSGDTVTVASIDFEKDTCYTEVLDADVYEKRHSNEPKRLQKGQLGVGRGPSGGSGTSNSHPADETMVVEPPDTERRSTRSQTMGRPSFEGSQSALQEGPGGPKFRLASKLSESVSVSDVGEKIMDSPITLNMRELFAVSTDISNYVAQQTRKHRLPVNSTTAATTDDSETPVTGSATAGTVPERSSVNQVSLYACPSSRVKVTLNASHSCWSLLDDGSEINIMPWRTWERLNYPIDTDIQWRVNSFEGRKDENGAVLGVCHGLPVDIGGVEVKTHVFVVENCEHNFILGCPWQRLSRASMVNEDERHVTWRIWSLDGRRVVQFVGVKADHERNKYHARWPLGGVNDGPASPLKA